MANSKKESWQKPIQVQGSDINYTFPKGNFFAAIKGIKEADRFQDIFPKIERWLGELKAWERNLMWENLKDIKEEEITTIIHSIISKSNKNDRKKQARDFGLFEVSCNLEIWISYILQIQKENHPKAQAIVTWLAGLEDYQASFFRGSISKFAQDSALTLLAVIANCADNNERTATAKGLGLMS